MAYIEPKLCDFNSVSIRVPRLKLLKAVFKRSYLSDDERIFCRALDWTAESAENKIKHIRSLCAKALLKTTGRT